MTRWKIARYLAIYGVLAAIGVTAGWQASSSGTRPRSATHSVGENGGLTAAGKHNVSFFIQGSVENLTPNRPTSLDLSISNPHPWPITIIAVEAIPDDASITCRAPDNLRIGSYDSSRPDTPAHEIASHAVLVLSLPVAIVNAPDRRQDACKDVIFPLHYFGVATTG